MAKAKAKAKTSRPRRARINTTVRRVGKSPIPVFATAGLVATGIELFASPATNIQYGSVIDCLTNKAQPTISKRIPFAYAALKSQATDLGTYYPVIGGAIVSSVVPKIPILGPMVRSTVRSASRGKARL